MKFDTIIIGGGLSGLVCGIRLIQEGQRCVIISSGQSALHFSSGSFDLLNYLPDGKQVISPKRVLSELIENKPTHPYAKLGQEKFERLTQSAEDFFKSIMLPIKGSVSQNHFRVTPMGTLKPTWLTISDFMTSEKADILPWKKVAIFNIVGFLDFYPEFIADEFTKLGVKSEIELFSLPEIDLLRRNPSEMRSSNIAWAIDKGTSFNKLVDILKTGSKDCDAVIFPACIGLKNDKIIRQIEDALGKPFYLVPTLPPSAVGIRTQQYLHDYFSKNGGTYMLGDTIKQADIEEDKITKLYSYNHKDIPFYAKNFVLATGSYFSQGLIATSERIYEPIFNLDVTFKQNREEWTNDNLFNPQNYQEFGVKTTSDFNAIIGKKTIENLYVAGAVLEGYNPIKEGSGGGVSILTAMSVAESILQK